MAEPGNGVGVGMSAMRSRRWNYIGRRDAQIVAGIAAVSGVIAAASGASPTGSEPVDIMWCAAVGAFTAWAAASAPWWGLVAASAIALAASLPGGPILVLVAVLALVGSLAIGRRKASVPWARALVGVAVAQVLLRLALPGPFGLESIVAAMGLVVLVLPALVRRPSTVRKRVWRGAGVIATLGFLALVGLAVAGQEARSQLVQGSDNALDGLDAIRGGNTETAAEQLSRATSAFDRADRSLAAPWAQLARLVPIVAQHHTAVTSLSDAAGDLTGRASMAALQVELERLLPKGGQVDLQQLGSAASALSDVRGAVADIEATVVEASSSWLIEPVQRRMDDLASDASEALGETDQALALAEIAPALLGSQGQRRYFVAFTTPAEARGLGGFMGNFAEVLAVDGKVTLTRFGRTLPDLTGGGPDPQNRRVSGPVEFLERYAWWGTGSDGNPVDANFWQNVTISPDLPTVGQVISELYPQSGGQPIDGVIVIDPRAMAALLQATGPIEVKGLPVPLDAKNAEQWLLTDQYELTAAQGGQEERLDVLEEAATALLNRVLGGDLPDPVKLSKVLGPVNESGHLSMWLARSTEQGVLDRFGITWRVPSPGDADGFWVTNANASSNKIDYYLRRRISYEAAVDASSGQVDATALVTLTNGAPSAGRVPYVIDNHFGGPAGTNQTVVTFYTPLAVTVAEIDGEELFLEAQREFGWTAYSASIALPPGGTVTVKLELEGQVGASTGYRLFLRPQPLAVPDQLDVSAVTTNGRRLVTFSGSHTKPLLLGSVATPLADGAEGDA